jgi:hypothetical protein
LEEEYKRNILDIATKDTIEQAFTTLSSIGWDCHLLFQHGAVTTAVFPLLLSRDWLNNELINMMMERLSMDLQECIPLKNKIIITPLEFSAEIIANGPKGSYIKKKGAGLLC